jgi:outer membrane receptor protein involved in Fe transport
MPMGALAGGVQTGDVTILDSVVVEGTQTDLVGSAESANEGVVTRKQLAARAVYRAAELLEATPGLIVSQHSGEGKANQYYLRGFNLDHGTDLRTTVDGMLVNQRSHSHGQGWTDLNFLIPELASGLQYRKGPYYADVGDFGSAGAVSIGYLNTLSQGIASVSAGENGYQRALLADSPKLLAGHLLYALELFHNDGPFIHPDNYKKVNTVLRYSQGDGRQGFNVTAMTYNAHWNSTDQIAQRAIDSGYISGRFDAIDPTDGGQDYRDSLSGEWHRSTSAGVTKANAYVIRQRLNLFSNFTYFLDDPVNGDQFNQPDRRTTSAFNVSHSFATPFTSLSSENQLGIQFQNDSINNGLQSTKARQVLSVTRQDHIDETSAAIYLQNSTTWLPKFRTELGVRADYYRFNVKSNIDANSGTANQSIVNPKVNLIFGPWAKTEYYLNLGGGFHSNDARGTVITVEPKTGLPADKVTPLVRSRGYEVGARTAIIPGLQSSLAIYQLDFDSELIFQGDAGTTSAGRASRRRGFEFANFYKPNNWLTIDADIAFARARFRDFDPVGDRIPGAVEGVASLSVAVDDLGPYFGSLQFRYFGPRPLIEDNSVRSNSTAIVNGRVGYKFTKDTQIDLEAFNLLDRQASAIDYYYTSRLPGEPAGGVNDVHFHPIESRSFRVGLTTHF